MQTRLADNLWLRLRAVVRRAAPARQARLYCVGAPRTGTHSVAAIFDRSIRSRHEPELRTVARHVLAHHRGLLGSDGLRAFVRRRDARLRLDVDSSHANAFLAEALVAEFADARFLLTIREPIAWLDSALNHARNSRRWSRVDRDYLAFYFDAANAGYSRHDAFLQQHGLPGVDCHLAAWARHNERVLATVPAERLLVVRTPEIAASLPRIAAFAGIAAARIAPRFRVRGEGRAKHGMLDRVDRAWLEDRVAARCGALLQRLFPAAASGCASSATNGEPAAS
jgi:hypothetical protein